MWTIPRANAAVSWEAANNCATVISVPYLPDKDATMQMQQDCLNSVRRRISKHHKNYKQISSFSDRFVDRRLLYPRTSLLERGSIIQYTFQRMVHFMRAVRYMRVCEWGVGQTNVQVLASNKVKSHDIYCCKQTIRKGPWRRLLY